MKYGTHPSKRTGVYYFDDCSGTVFEGKFGKFQLKGVANSIITFPGSLRHTAPVNKSGARLYCKLLKYWKSGRVVYGTGLENQRGCKSSVGSNPTSSVIISSYLIFL